MDSELEVFLVLKLDRFYPVGQGHHCCREVLKKQANAAVVTGYQSEATINASQVAAPVLQRPSGRARSLADGVGVADAVGAGVEGGTSVGGGSAELVHWFVAWAVQLYSPAWLGWRPHAATMASQTSLQTPLP